MAIRPPSSRGSTLRPVPVTVDDACGDEAVLRSLLRRGVLVESAPGRYYLDEGALSRRRRTGLPVVGALLALAAVALLAARALRD